MTAGSVSPDSGFGRATANSVGTNLGNSGPNFPAGQVAARRSPMVVVLARARLGARLGFAALVRVLGMKLAIMQPYVFPYMGYFQLISAVDLFVLYDDVAFIKQGWINRNVLGARHGPQLFTLPLCSPRLGQPISQINFYRPQASRRRLLNTIESLYRRAPYYQRARPVLEAAIGYDEENLASCIMHSLGVLNVYLGIETPIVRSSERHADLKAKGEARVIAICRAEGADTYIKHRRRTAPL